VQIDDGLNEVDFGEWTGLTFDVLNARMEWQRFNSSRSVAEVPCGETASEVQQRIVGRSIASPRGIAVACSPSSPSWTSFVRRSFTWCTRRSMKSTI